MLFVKTYALAIRFFTIEMSAENATLSSGISVQVKVQFYAENLTGPVHDSLIVKFGESKGETVFVPLSGYPCCAKIGFDPFINLGTAVVNNQLVRMLTFKNKGSRRGNYTIKFEIKEEGS